MEELNLPDCENLLNELNNAYKRLKFPDGIVTIEMNFNKNTHVFSTNTDCSIGRKDSTTTDPVEFPNHIGFGLPNVGGCTFSRKLMTIGFFEGSATVNLFAKAANRLVASRSYFDNINSINTDPFKTRRALNATITFLLIAKQIPVLHKDIVVLIAKKVYFSNNDDCWKVKTFERGDNIKLTHGDNLYIGIPSVVSSPKKNVLYIKLAFLNNRPTTEDDLSFLQGWFGIPKNP